MQSRRHKLLSSTVVPLVIMTGVAAVGAAVAPAVGTRAAQAACNPCAAKKCNPCNPCAAAACNPCNPCAAAKACNPCNPCAAAKACNPCNPCAAAKCNPCNPCAAANPCNPCGACNPCNPCAAGGGKASLKCAVPRLRTAALCNPCNPCNPCAAAKACNPCSPCNPCAAAKCNPCNPCAAAKACNPCNPCAAAKCNPCNPCAAANPCNPCNPCAAANPCNPCGACNPCAAGGGAELTTAEAVAVYDCLIKGMKAGYAKSDNGVAAGYTAWRRYSNQPYVSATHGGRYVQNYGNDKARNYALYERSGQFAVGAQLAKDSFGVKGNGSVTPGPLFIMEKMPKGFHKASDDWRYTMIMPNGAVFGTTKGAGSQKVEFCIGCHQTVTPDQDSVMLLPEEYRTR